MNLLDRIVATKRREIAVLRGEDFASRLASAPAPLGFRRALERADVPLALIAEVKQASPSEGLICRDFDPATLARAYRAAGAHALSVLTDRDYFRGDPRNLAEAKAASGLPALRKDFILEPIQVDEARALGADAILLIVAILCPKLLRVLREHAEALGMDAVVEAHTPEEARLAVESGATLIGVNNRDLATFETRLETAEQIIPSLPTGTLAIAESALHGPVDVARMERAGARAVLIGTAFCGSPDPGAKIREVMGW